MKDLLLMLVFVGFCTSAALATFDFTLSGTEYDSKTLNSQSLLVTGGGADHIDARGSSYVEVWGTTPLAAFSGIHALDILDTTTLNYYGGETSLFTIWDNASAVFEGGRIDFIYSYQNVSLPNIEMIVKEYDFNISTDVLTGLWADDSAFSIQLTDQSGYADVIDNIAFTIVPEPATLSIMCLGALLLKKRRDR